MNEMWAAILGAFWLGILTSISPCPLATNIAASTYIGKKLGDAKSVIYSGLLYTLGRTLVYLAIGIALVSGFSSAYVISNFLQKYMNKILGPVLILAGMFLLELLFINFDRLQMKEETRDKLEKSGLWGSLLMGGFFALSFCPVSAALFFGGLIPLAMNFKSNILMPILFGIGTGLPVVVFAFLAAFSAQSLGKVFNKINIFELWARRVTGSIFILAGIYYMLKYIFEVI